MLYEKNLVDKKESLYFNIMLISSILIFLILLVSIMGFIFLLSFAVMFFVMQGMMIGHIKQNAVKVSEKQFSDVHNKVFEYCNQLGINKYPDVYVMQSGGTLNALATRFLAKDFVVIYSDILELAYEKGEDAVNFIIAHELAHIKRKHLSKRIYICLASFIPLLGFAYSRACENTCDNYAAFLTHGKHTQGFLVLIAGKKLYSKVDINEIIKQSTFDDGFWCWLSEICSTHPNLTKRIARMSQLTLQENVEQPANTY